jgi:DNA mismatch repair protein MutL
MPIRVLSDQVASQIAAGEVVERPASVVKELIENAVDAGATAIQVDVREGGRRSIQVADNGTGIAAAELEVAFLRHATSKLATAGDLHAIATLGFRGEALAAIAAVSQVTAVSRHRDEPAGTRLVLEGGRVTAREAAGAPQGTVVNVANLFYNVPARLKFLKAVTTERRVIDDYVTRYALAYPGIRFRLAHDGRITFQSSGNGELIDVLLAAYGPDVTRQLLPLADDDRPGEGPPAGIAVHGFTSPPDLHYAHRNQITLFVNGRWIKDSSLAFAAVQAYHTLLPTGRYPLVTLFLTMPPEDVDVNVHPTKIEVRFRQPEAIFGAVQRTVRRTLVGASPVPQVGLHFDSFRPGQWAAAHDRNLLGRHEPAAAYSQLDLAPPGGPVEAEGNGTEPARPLAKEQLPVMRVVGQVGTAYIIAEGPEGLFLIDQHAAHERILYERFMVEWEAGHRAAAQGLVQGEVVHLSPSQATLLQMHLDLLAGIGLQVEPFGPNAFVVRTVPAVLGDLDPARALLEVVDELEEGDRPLQRASEAAIILRVCKTAAVKAGQSLSHAEMEALVRQLEQCASPHTCPHGRPTLIHLSVATLAREFGRT